MIARVGGESSTAGSVRMSAVHTGRRSRIAIGVVPSRHERGRSSAKAADRPRTARNRMAGAGAPPPPPPLPRRPPPRSGHRPPPPRPRPPPRAPAGGEGGGPPHPHL